MSKAPLSVEDRLAELERSRINLERRLDAAARRARRALAVDTLAVAGAVTWSASPQARAQFGITLTNLNNRLTAVEAKTAPLSVNGSDFFITGKNVHIVSGSGSTDDGTAAHGGDLSGLGNLIVSYNAPLGYGLDRRSGSHNLVLGDFNNYTSFGGLVAGTENEISGQYASVSGGASHFAGGNAASVSGGTFRFATGSWNWAAGGLFQAQ